MGGVLEYRSAGISLPAADGRYVKRFVGATLTADTYAVNAAGGAENVLANPNGPIMAGIPLNAAAAVLASGKFARVNSGLDVMREASSFASLRVVRINGTYAAPSAVTSGQQLGEHAFGGWDGAAVVSTGAVKSLMRENLTTIARGSRLRMEAYPIGSVTALPIADFQVDAGIAELVGLQTEMRYIPLTSGTLRSPSNSSDVLSWGEANVAFFGGTRVTRRAAIANPTDLPTALTAIIAILDALRPTTGYNLIAP